MDANLAPDLADDQGLEQYDERRGYEDFDLTGHADGGGLTYEAEEEDDEPDAQDDVHEAWPPGLQDDYAQQPPVLGLTPEQEAHLNELYLSNPAAAMRLLIQHEIRQAVQTEAASVRQLRQAEQEAPGFYRVHGTRVRRAMELLEPQVRGSRDGIAFATLYAIGEEASQTGDLRGAILRAAQLMSAQGGGRAASRPAAPPSQRVPRATASAPASRGSYRPLNGSRGDIVANRLQRSLGLTRSTANSIVEEL